MAGASTRKLTIDYGDQVVVYVNYGLMYNLTVTKGSVFQTKYGALRHDALVGLVFGSKVQCTKGHVYALYPTIELRIQSWNHRTQILYPQDQSLIITGLDLCPGRVVVEAGTGSGALSRSIIRAIRPTGLLYTFDFHQQRSEAFASELSVEEIASFATCLHADVCRDGFGDACKGVADAVFLDLPQPWLAIPHAKQSLNNQFQLCRICTFSPCIEQVQRSCTALAANGFVDIRTFECVSKLLKVHCSEQPVLLPKEKVGQVSKSGDQSLESEDGPVTAKQGKLDRASNDADKTVASLEEALEECSDRNDDDGCCVKSVHSLIAFPAKQPTHTGYLTFASLPPLLISGNTVVSTHPR